MELHIQYLTDDHGCKTAVQIPLDEWRELAADYRHLRQCDTMKKNLDRAFQEVEKLHRRKGKKTTLNEFLHEC